MTSIDEPDLIDRVQKFKSIALDGLKDLHERWNEIDQYFLSNQWSNDMIQRMPRWRSKPVYNIIFETVEGLHAIMTDQRPVQQAYQRAGGTQRVANIITRHMEQLHIDQRIERKNSMKWKDKLLKGTGFWKMLWNSKTKNIEVERVSPRNILPDPLAKDIPECRYLTEERMVPLSDIVEQYPDKIDEIMATRDETLSRAVDQDKMEIDGTAKVVKNQTWFMDSAFEDDIEGKEIAEKAAKKKLKYPRGRVVTWVGDVILEDKPNPHEFDELLGLWPYVRDPCIEVPDEFWGISPADLMLSGQDEVNRLDAMIYDNINTVANPLNIAIRGTLDSDAFTSNPNALIEVDADSTDAFKRDRGTPLPDQVFKFREIKIEEIRAVVGMRQVLQGDVSASQRPGAVRAAIDSAMQRIRELIRLNNHGLEILGEMMVDTMTRKYKPGRFIAVSSSDDDFEDLSSPTVSAEVREAMNSPAVQRELMAMRRQIQIGSPNPEFTQGLQEGIANGLSEDEARAALKLKGILELKDDLRDGRYGYRVEIHTLQGRDPESVRQTVTDLLRYGNGEVVDAEAVWENVELVGKQRMIKRIRERDKLKLRVAELEQQLQAVQGQAQAGPALTQGG